MTTRERLAAAIPFLRDVAQTAAEQALESGATWKDRETIVPKIVDDVIESTLECIEDGGYETAEQFMEALNG